MGLSERIRATECISADVIGIVRMRHAVDKVKCRVLDILWQVFRNRRRPAPKRDGAIGNRAIVILPSRHYCSALIFCLFWSLLLDSKLRKIDPPNAHYV